MNSPPPDDSHQWGRALDLLIAGELPVEEARELQERMKADASLLSLYLDKMRMESLLRDHPWPREEAAPAPRVVRWKWPVLAAAACVALLLTVGLWLRPEGGISPGQVVAHTAAPEVQFSAASRFATMSPETSEDGRLPLGDGVVMEDGSVSIRLPTGVEAVLKSPSRFAITEANRLKLDQGTGWFRVPPGAKGFTVDLPEMEVVDLGTVFTVSVDASEHQVQVEQGRVEVRQRKGGLPPQTLKTGEKLVRRANADTVQIIAGSALLNPDTMQEAPEIVFHESLAHVPDQAFTERQPLKGRWEVLAGAPKITGGRFAPQSDFTHLMGRFTRPVEPSENAVVLLTFKSVSPMTLFHSKGFAGISLFDGDGEVFFFGDKSSDSYSWNVIDYGKTYRKPGEQNGRKHHDLSIQGSEETFTLRYRQRTGEFEVFRGRGVQGLPIVRGKSDPGLRFDGVRIANGKGGDFSFEDIEVSVVKDRAER